MTRRERMERRRDRRLEWADGRDSKAAVLLKQNEPYQGDCAFNTQPGHIPERARAIARTDRACEHHDMANHHRSKAAGIDAQLDRAIYSDDPDAPERLREKIADLEAERARMKDINAQVRKGPGWGARLAAAGAPLTEDERHVLGDVAKFQPYYCTEAGPVFPPYALSNIGGNISRLRKRLAQVETERTATDDASRAADQDA